MDGIDLGWLNLCLFCINVQGDEVHCEIAMDVSIVEERRD